MIKKVLLTCLTTLLGLFFVFSGLVKLYPIEFFELTFVDIGVSSWHTAPFVARFFISIEVVLGLFLIFNFQLKKFAYKATLWLLGLFTIYLLFLLFAKGNNGNCNCLGSFLPMTPAESILKNLVLIVITLVLSRFHAGFEWKFKKLFFIIFALISLSIPYILNPVDISSSATFDEEVVNYKLDLDIIYNDAKTKAPSVELRKGKWIISFMSLTCQHCRIGAYKFHILKKRNPKLPIYLFLNGDEENLKPFFEESSASNIPHSLFLGAKNFLKLSGPFLPAIYYVNNGVVEKKVKYYDLDQSDIEKWLE